MTPSGCPVTWRDSSSAARAFVVSTLQISETTLQISENLLLVFACACRRQSERQHLLRLSDIVSRVVNNRARFEARNLKREKRELNYMLNQKTYVEVST